MKQVRNSVPHPRHGAFFTIEQLCGVLGVTRPTIYKWFHSGRLRRYVVDGVVRVSEKQLEDFLGINEACNVPANSQCSEKGKSK